MGNLLKTQFDARPHLHRVEEVLGEAAEDDFQGENRTRDHSNNYKEPRADENNHPEKEIERGKPKDDEDPAKKVKERRQDDDRNPDENPQNEAEQEGERRDDEDEDEPKKPKDGGEQQRQPKDEPSSSSLIWDKLQW